MPLMRPDELAFARTVSELVHCNPFTTHRIELERQALGSEFVEADAEWNLHPQSRHNHPNLLVLQRRLEEAGERLRVRLVKGAKATEAERALYEDLVLLALYHRLRGALDETFTPAAAGARAGRPAALYRQLEQEAARAFVGAAAPSRAAVPHFFACAFQLRRAVHHIFDAIIGVSRPAVRLRAEVWQSVFTHDMRRYRRLLFDRMTDISTLVMGASGTGKELVARAIGLSRYIPFDATRGGFVEDFEGSFIALNLSAMSPTLIESELFGHRRGAFTGAVADRVGFLEACPPLGTVFLDEIGELDAAIQVKLLRVIQTRTFQRLGETEDRPFRGKIIAATNRDLAAAMAAGRFREDLYYRLCSDLIRTPTLAEQLADAPGDLGNLLRHIARRLVGREADALSEEARIWIARNLGTAYAWPGNIRELEQCVRNVLVRGEYRPARAEPTDTEPRLSDQIEAGALTADALLERYCAIVYRASGSYEAAARRLGLDRRTVKARVLAASRREATRGGAGAPASPSSSSGSGGSRRKGRSRSGRARRS
jgi:transcriptional regulator with AAA-type ATPase domain